MANASGTIIDQIARAGIASWFKSAGFSKKGRSFYRIDGTVIHTANLQAATHNSNQAVRFAVNLGVEWPHWHRIWTDGKPLKNPALAPTYVQTRLHPNTGPGQDYWWAATDASRACDKVHEIVTALEAFAESFWAHYGDLSATLQDIESGKRVPTGAPRTLVHVALLQNANRSSEARLVLMDAVKRAPSQKLVQAVAERLGLRDDA